MKLRKIKRTKLRNPGGQSATAANLQQLLDAALQLHRSGRLQEAAAVYQRVLSTSPSHPDALHLLGLLAYQTGRDGDAAVLIKKAISNNARVPQFHNNLGLVLLRLGRFEEAAASFTSAVHLRPAYPEAHFNLGNVFHDQGRWEEALANYHQAVHLKPDYAAARYNLGIVYRKLGRRTEAIHNYQEAIRLQPDYAEAYNNLGKALGEEGDLERARRELEKAISIKPDYAEAYNNLGLVLQSRGDLALAVASYCRATQINPHYGAAHHNLGLALKKQGRLEDAAASLKNALECQPDYAEAHNNLGLVLHALHKIDSAQACFRKAIECGHDYVEAHNNLGNLLSTRGDLEGAAAQYRQAISLRPNYVEAYGNLGTLFMEQARSDEALAMMAKALAICSADHARPADHKRLLMSRLDSNRLLSLHYRFGNDAARLYAEHRAWEARYAQALPVPGISYNNPVSLDRPLRLGYVSPDFRRHSVAFFFEPILRAHDRSRFELFCYADVEMKDDVTARLQGLSDNWRDIASLADEEVAGLIVEDRIDILVDLAGHMANNRMLVFARKPAPVQVTYLGYPNTTGLSTVDYRITDQWADPAGLTEQYHTEELIRLPQGFLCYQPPADAPEAGPLPAKESGIITFGSFNNLAKVTPEIIDAWSCILQAVPASCFLVRAKALSDKESVEYITTMFRGNGIAPDRLKLCGRLASFTAHLATHGQVDICLDTFPYNGTTTTCEALWMGVPVIVLAGQSHVARVGVSLLHNTGLDELIAETVEQYVDKAVKLAGDLERLQSLRAGLRSRLAGSSLTQPHVFTPALERAYLEKWRAYRDNCNHNADEEARRWIAQADN